MMKTQLIDQQCINTIRTLSMDAVQQVKARGISLPTTIADATCTSGFVNMPWDRS